MYFPVSFPCGLLHDIYRKKVVSLYGASPYCLFPGCIVTWAWSLAKGQYMVSWFLTGAPQNKDIDKIGETANVGLVSSVGRALARQSVGRRFKSHSSKFFPVHPNLSPKKYFPVSFPCGLLHGKTNPFKFYHNHVFEKITIFVYMFLTCVFKLCYKKKVHKIAKEELGPTCFPKPPISTDYSLLFHIHRKKVNCFLKLQRISNWHNIIRSTPHYWFEFVPFSFTEKK